MRLPLIRLAIAGGMGFLASGCNGDAITCVPVGAEVQPAGSKPAGAPVPPANVDLYLDVSGSMRGFLPDELKARPKQPGKANQESQTTYESVLNGLNEFLKTIAQPGADKQYYQVFAFDTNVCAQTGFTFAQPLKPDFYNGSRVKCAQAVDHTRTELGPTLSNIEKAHVSYKGNQPYGDPERLSIVVTDLILPDKNDAGRIPRDFKAADSIIRSGLAIAVLGIRIPFNGTLYDITNQSAFTGLLPLYLVIVGDPDRIIYFLTKLQTGTLKSQWNGNRWIPQMVQLHLFTRDRFLPGNMDGALRGRSGVVRETGKPLVNPEGAPVRSFLLGSESFVLGPERTQSVDLVPSETANGLLPMLPGTWPIDMQVSARTWVFDGEGSQCATGWKPFPKEPLKAEMVIKDNALRISGFENEGIVSDLTYLTHLETTARKRAEPQWPAWWQPDWSLDDLRQAQRYLGPKENQFRL